MTPRELRIDLRPAGEPGFVAHANANLCAHTGLHIPERSCTSCTGRMIRERGQEAAGAFRGSPTDFGGELAPRITYTPTGGDPSTQSRKLTLRKR